MAQAERRGFQGLPLTGHAELIAFGEVYRAGRSRSVTRSNAIQLEPRLGEVLCCGLSEPIGVALDRSEPWLALRIYAT
jgi:hypothetical protein